MSLTPGERLTLEQQLAVAEAQRRAAAQPEAMRWRSDPIAWASEVLGFRPWPRQAEILRAVADHPRVAVRSGHKTGKSTALATLALWWYDTRPGARVIITAPTGRQVRSILWREIRRLHGQARRQIAGRLSPTPDAGLQGADGREVVGFSTDEPERLAGWSGDGLLFLVDEASGVDEVLYEALEGNRAGGGAHLALFSNPTQTAGQFYRAFTDERERWYGMHVSSEEAAAFQRDVRIIPGLASQSWVDEKRAEWGEASPLYQVRVRGNFPSQGDNAVIGLALVEAARRRWMTTPDEGRLELGVDVARYGDDETVIQAVRGKRALQPIALRSLDSIEVANKVLEVVRTLRRAPSDKPRVKVDVIGYGAGTYDFLARSAEVEAVAVNVGEGPTALLEDGEPDYALLRDQLWFGGREWLRAGGALPPDGKLESELVAPVYGFTAAGKRKVEAKDRTKERLGRSPDRADALLLAIYNPPARTYVGTIDGDWMSDR